MPPKQCRLSCGSGHGLDGIPDDFANVPELNHGGVIRVEKSVFSGQTATPMTNELAAAHDRDRQAADSHQRTGEQSIFRARLFGFAVSSR